MPDSGAVQRYGQTARRHQNIAWVIANVFFRESQCFFHRVDGAVEQHILGELTVKASDEDEMSLFRQARDGIGLIRTDEEAFAQLGLDGIGRLQRAAGLFKDLAAAAFFAFGQQDDDTALLQGQARHRFHLIIFFRRKEEISCFRSRKIAAREVP